MHSQAQVRALNVSLFQQLRRHTGHGGCGNGYAGVMKTSSVESQNFSMRVHQRSSGKSAIEDQVGANELPNFTTAPCAPSAIDKSGENSGAGYDISSPTPRQSQDK